MDLLPHHLDTVTWSNDHPVPRDITLRRGAALHGVHLSPDCSVILGVYGRFTREADEHLKKYIDVLCADPLPDDQGQKSP